MPRKLLRSYSSILGGLSLLVTLLAPIPWTGVSTVNSAAAQDVAPDSEPEETGPEIPLVVINFSGVDRILGDVDYIFEAAGRQDMSDVLRGLLGNIGDLKGLDRDKPFGVMLFLQPGFPPQPQPVGFLPVTDLDDLMTTLSVGPITARKVQGEDDRYELVGNRQTFQVLMKGEYAFVANTVEALDVEFPDPEEYNKALSNRYDIAVSVNLNSIPTGMKTLIADFVRAQAEADLQQRDDEPDAAYQMRRAGGESNLELFEKVLTQGESLTIGLDASRERRTAVFEFVINATADSAFAKVLKDIGSTTSYFTSLINDTSPLTFSVSWTMDEREKKVLTRTFEGIEKQVKTDLEEGSPLEKPLTDLIEALKETANAGHLDFFAQFRGQPPETYVMVGGFKVARGRTAGSSIVEVLRFIQQNPEKSNNTQVEMNVDVHQGISFHKLVGGEQDEGGQRIFGENAGLYFGVGANVVWFAIGGDNAMPELKKAMDFVAENPARNLAEGRSAPFQLMANATQWLDKIGPPDGNGEGVKLARDAFATGQDMLKIDVRPTENGARVQIRLDEGFIRLLGLAISRQYDNNQL